MEPPAHLAPEVFSSCKTEALSPLSTNSLSPPWALASTTTFCLCELAHRPHISGVTWHLSSVTGLYHHTVLRPHPCCSIWQGFLPFKGCIIVWHCPLLSMEKLTGSGTSLRPVWGVTTICTQVWLAPWCLYSFYHIQLPPQGINGVCDWESFTTQESPLPPTTFV